MASLNKNGTELFRLHLLREDRSYRSNGVVLINKGFGWKKGKTYDDIHAIIEQRKATEEKVKRNLPCFVKYRKAVQDEFPLSIRWKYLAAAEMLGDDIDGIWSSLDDDRISVSIEDIAHIHNLREASLLEMKKSKEPINA